MNRAGLAFIFFLALIVNTPAFSQPGNDTLVNYAYPERYTIAGIRVLSDGTVDNNLVIAVSGLRIGQTVSVPGDDITKALQNLWKQQLFSKASITMDSIADQRIWLTIHITSRPRLSKYTITGVSKSKAKKLRDEAGLEANDIVTEALLSRVVKNIKDFYLKKGHPGTKVDIKANADTAVGRNKVDLVIHVDPGKRTKIETIDFVGNESFPDKKLKKLMKKTKERQFYNVFRNSKFKPEEYEADKQKVIAFYQRNGYKDAVIKTDSTWMSEDNRMSITLKLDEGRKYYFRNISWAGNTKYDTRFLNTLLGIKRGDLYNPEQLERSLYISETSLDITSLYMDDGYLFFSVTPVEVLVQGDSVDLEIRIFEGPQATINHVTVTGNTKTHDHVILRELRTKPGMKFSRSDIIRSQRELAMMTYFDPEKMNVIPKPNPKDGTVDLEYQVVEKPSDQIELSGGWGAGRIIGVLGLTLNNFSIKNIGKPKLWQGYPSGDGQRLSIRAQSNGPQFQSYNLSFTEPWFGGRKPISFTLSGFYNVQNYGLAGTGEQSLRSPGVTAGWGKRLKWPDDYFTGYLSASYQYYTFNNYQLIENFSTGFSNNFNIRAILSRNSLNDNIYPSGGSSVNFQINLTPPYSYLWNKGKDYTDATPQEKFKWIEYHKWKFDAAHYLGLAGRKRKLVLYSKAEFGLIGLYNKSLGLTPFERFLVGGDGLAGFSLSGTELIRLRGYDSYDDVTPKSRGMGSAVVESGATIYNRYVMEVRYPLITSQAATIYGLSFIEGGNAWLRFKDFDPFSIKRSAGFGIRAFLPMFGMLGFDWGYGFDDSISPFWDKQRSHFHFYIGQPLGG